jgi:hypothetical protein
MIGRMLCTEYSEPWPMARTIRLDASHRLPHRVQQICVWSTALLGRPQTMIEFSALHELTSLVSSLRHVSPCTQRKLRGGLHTSSKTENEDSIRQ